MNNMPSTNMIPEPDYMKHMSFKYGKLQGVIYGFIETDYLAARIVGLSGYKNILSAYSSYYSSIKRLHVPVRVSKKGDELFLIRTDRELYHVDDFDVSKYF